MYLFLDNIKNLVRSAGDLLIVMAQVATAMQMVIEEKFLTKYDVPPLLVVAWEGEYQGMFFREG